MASDWERQAEQKALQRQLAKERRSEADDLTSRKEKKKMTESRKKHSKSRDTKLSPTKNRKKPMAKKVKSKKPKSKRLPKSVKRLAGKVVNKAAFPVVLGKVIAEEGMEGAGKMLKDEAQYFTCTGDENICKDIKKTGRAVKKAAGYAKGGLVKKSTTRCKCRGGGKATQGLGFNK